MVGVIEYYFEKTKNNPTADIPARDFIVRVGKWIAYGDANLSSPGPRTPLLNGTTTGGLYTPLGTPFWWNRNTTGVDAIQISKDYFQNGETRVDVQEPSVMVGTLLVAAPLSGDAYLKSKGYQLFRDCAFYKDTQYAPMSPTFRHGISFRSPLFGGTYVKSYGQTAFGGLHALAIIEGSVH